MIALAACGSAPEVVAEAAPAADTAAAAVPAAAAPAAAESAPAAAVPAAPAPAAVSKTTPAADIKFRPFNPKDPEGIQVSPFAGNPRTGAFSAVVKLPAGRKLPLHSHTHGFGAMTLTDGVVHGVSHETAKALPAGSIWYQPGGEVHVDACASEVDCLFVVFFDGAVDMKPAEKPLEGEPKMTVTPADKIQWKEVKGGVKMAVIKGNPMEGPFQALFDFPAGMETNVHTHTADFSAVLSSGTHHRGPSADKLVTITKGSVWNEPSGSPHMEKCGAESNCVFGCVMNGALDTKNVEVSTTKAAE